MSWAICGRVLSINSCVYTLGATTCLTTLNHILRIKSHSTTASSRATTTTAGRLVNKLPSRLRFAAGLKHQGVYKVNWNTSTVMRRSGRSPAPSMKNIILLLTTCYQRRSTLLSLPSLTRRQRKLIADTCIDTFTHTVCSGEGIRFSTPVAEEEYEVTGHGHVRLAASLTDNEGEADADLDVHVALRKINAQGNESLYSSSIGTPTPVVFGWLRASHRTIDPNPYPDSFHLPVPVPSHKKSDKKEVINGQVYDLQIELWPTNVVVEKGERLVLEISPKDPAGADPFACHDPIDRSIFPFETIFRYDSRTDNRQGTRESCAERIMSILARATKAMSSCQLFRHVVRTKLSRPQISFLLPMVLARVLEYIGAMGRLEKSSRLVVWVRFHSVLHGNMFKFSYSGHLPW